MENADGVAEECLSSQSPLCPLSRALQLLDEAQRERGMDKSIPAGELSPTTATPNRRRPRYCALGCHAFPHEKSYSA
jgi:hypothetical protein